jgi:hypothetical protein
MAADGERYTPPELTSVGYLEHDLQVVSLLVELARANAVATGAGRGQGLLEASAFTAVGPRRGRLNPRDERRPPDASEASKFGDLGFRPGGSAPGFLEPDLTLTGMTARGARGAALFEYDRTRRAVKQLARLRRYDYFLTRGWRESRYARLDAQPMLVVVCATDKQLPSFLAGADSQLTAHVYRGAVDSPRNADYPGRENVAFTSRPRLLAGDWRVLLVDPLPPDARYPHESFEPVTKVLPFDTVFTHLAAGDDADAA